MSVFIVFNEEVTAVKRINCFKNVKLIITKRMRPSEMHAFFFCIQRTKHTDRSN